MRIARAIGHQQALQGKVHGTRRLASAAAAGASSTAKAQKLKPSLPPPSSRCSLWSHL